MYSCGSDAGAGGADLPSTKNCANPPKVECEYKKSKSAKPNKQVQKAIYANSMKSYTSGIATNCKLSRRIKNVLLVQTHQSLQTVHLEAMFGEKLAQHGCTFKGTPAGHVEHDILSLFSCDKNDGWHLVTNPLKPEADAKSTNVEKPNVHGNAHKYDSWSFEDKKSGESLTIEWSFDKHGEQVSGVLGVYLLQTLKQLHRCMDTLGSDILFSRSL